MMKRFGPKSSLGRKEFLLGILCLLLVPKIWAQEDHADPLRQKPSQLLLGEVRAVCYSGFRSGQHPDRGQGAKNPSEEEILEDLRIIVREGFKLIRVYDSRENSASILKLIRSHQLDLKVMLGAWLNAEVNNPLCPWDPPPIPEETLIQNKKDNLVELERLIILANQYPKIVFSVAVGNESLVDWNDHMVPIESVLSYVQTVKAAVEQPVTVADNYVWWAKHGQALAQELDFVSVHIYPAWEGKTVDEAIAFGIENMMMVREALPQSQLVITEAGWATVASEFGERASEEAQAQYYQELYQWAESVNITTFFFEAFDEDWKGNPDNPLGAEKHWGLYDIHRKPKKVFAKSKP